MKAERYLALGLAATHAFLTWACAFASLVSYFNLKGIGTPASTFGLHIQFAFYVFPLIPAIAGIFFIRSAFQGRISTWLLASILLAESLFLALAIAILALPYTCITYSIS